MSALSYLLRHQIVAIIRGMQLQDAISLANALHSGGIDILEITLNSPNAIAVIEQLSDVYKDKMLIGAGTVLSDKEAKQAIAAGAQFIISPSLDTEVIKATRDAGMVSIPGAFTPTEIVTAYKSGADIVKVFPVPNADYIKSILAPLNHIPLMPTGGINAGNIKDYQKAGAAAFGIGSWLVNNKETVTETYLQNLQNKARSLKEAIALT